MATNDPDLEKLIRMLGQCLGRIDAQAYRLQDDGGEYDYGTADRLEDETALLQELVSSLLVVEADDDSDAVVNEVVERVLTSCLDELDIPIVIRTDLTANSTRVAAPRTLVTVSLQRAMELALSPLRPGDELRLSTRIENGDLLVEIEANGSDRDRLMAERTETLRDFVQSFGGSCQVHCESSGPLLLVMELPRAHVTDRSETDGFA